MAAVYAIDGQNLKTLGFDVKAVTGIYDTPARKPVTEINPALSSGVIALHGSNDYFVKERQIVIDTLLLASSVDDALTKLAILQALLYTAGTRELMVSYSNILYVCYCADGCDIERLNSVFDNPVAYSVKIKLVEINPMLKMSAFIELLTAWTNVGGSWNTFTSVGKNITLAIEPDSSQGTAHTNAIAVPPTALRLTINLTVNSGNVPALRVYYTMGGSGYYGDLDVLEAGYNVIDYTLPIGATDVYFALTNLLVVNPPPYAKVNCNFTAIVSIKEYLI